MHKIGQRVKKVRGICNLGKTGVVVSHRAYMAKDTEGNPYPCDMEVCHDQATMDIYGRNHPPGTTMLTLSENWEPIIDDGSAPSRYSFEELMDKFAPAVNPDESRALVVIEKEKA